MEMFGGLTRTSSRIAIAAALGLGLGGYALSASPANAQGYGGNCCADLEERVAELEASTVQKGNKKVSVTISGWVIKTMNWWTDGEMDNFAVGDKDADLASRFAITGSATIAPGWSAGYNLTVTAPSNTFGILSNQVNDIVGVNGSIQTLYSYGYIKSDDYGTLNLGTLSPASDNAAVLADISGTVIESNAVWFEGGGFFLRPDGNNGLAGVAWNNFLFPYCNGGVGADCFGAPRPAVRYDSPTFGGFRMETSYGSLPGGAAWAKDSNFWDIAVFYNGDWGDFKISAAYAYTWTETAQIGNALIANPGSNSAHQVGATAMHTPSGLGLYGEFEYEDPNTNGVTDTNLWYLKPFIKRSWNPLGATILYGEYGQYNDFYGNIAFVDMCPSFGGGTNVGTFCGNNAGSTVQVSGSEMQRWGLGAVQEIDAAAMHVFARWQHQIADVDFVGTTAVGGRQTVKQGFEDFDVFQVGGIIFF